MKKNKNLKLYFLGGPVQNISQTLGLNGNAATALGGVTDLTEGIFTGNPMSIVSGAGNLLSGGIGLLSADKKAYENALKERDSKFGSASVFANGGLVEYNNGGTHEENELGGIPMGISPEGQMNTVEQGETRNEDYIFSDRRKLGVKELDMFNLPKKFKGKTYAEVSKILNREFKERPHDKISKDTKAAMLKKLELASEATMPNDNRTEQFDEGGLMPITPISGIIATDEFKPTLDTTALENRANSRTLDISEKEKYDKQLRNNLKMASIGEDFGNFLSDPSSLRYAPVIGGALDYLSLKKPEEISLQKSTARYKPNYISTEGLDPKLTALRRKAIADITGTSGGNLATARAGMIGSNVGFTEGVSDAYRDIALSNISQDQAAQQFNANIDQFNIGQSNLEEQINAQNQAAYSQAKRQGLQNIFQNIGNIGQEQNLADIVTKAYGHTPKGTKKKCGGKLRFK